MTMRIHGDKIEFPDGTEQFTASSGGSGGGEVTEKEAVVFRGTIENTFTIPDNIFTKIPIDIVGIDTNNALVDGKFKPSVAGYYQINGSVNQGGASAQSNQTTSAIYKNGILNQYGTDVKGTIAFRSSVSSIVYLDPEHKWTDADGNEQVGDYVELWGRIIGATPSVLTKGMESTSLSAHLITGQSSGGSGEATGTPSSFARIVDEKPKGESGGSSISGTQDRTLNKIEYDTDNIVTLSDDKEFTLQAGTYVIDFSAPAFRTNGTNAWLYSVTDSETVALGSSVNSKPGDGASTVRSEGSYSVTLTNPHTYKIQQYTGTASATNGLGVDNVIGKGFYTSVDIQKVGTGGSGGSYTPEKMVWEDVKAERAFDKEEINDNDVPLYVAVDFRTSDSQAQSYVQLYVDNVLQITSGSASDQINANLNLFYIIPAKSKYIFRESAAGKNTLTRWHEARMPVAVGTGGGKTVAFSAHQSSVQSIPGMSFVKMNLDTVEFDTDNCFSDSRFTAKVSGYYQVNGQCAFEESVLAPQVLIYTKDGSYKKGNVADSGSWANVSSVMYLNEGDWIELHFAHINGSEIKNTTPTIDTNYFSAILVSGGSASGGDSIWKDVDGDAVLETKDKKLTIDANVGELGLKSRITTDASILELKAGSGGLPDVTISDTEINLGSDTVTTTRLKGSLFAQGVWNDTASVGETPNVCVGNDGKLFRSLTTTYTTEEVDKKLAVMQKIIDKLEKKLK